MTSCLGSNAHFQTCCNTTSHPVCQNDHLKRLIFGLFALVAGSRVISISWFDCCALGKMRKGLGKQDVRVGNSVPDSRKAARAKESGQGVGKAAVGDTSPYPAR